MKNRLRFAERVAGISALALLAVLLLGDWFGGASGWDALGWLALALCVLTVAAGLSLPVVFGAYESPVLPLLAATFTLAVGLLAVIALLVQVVAQPGTDEQVAVQAGWWLGLLAAAGVARGGFLSMRDEYLPGVAVPDVPVRPAPAA